VGQFHWDAGTYLEVMRGEVPAYSSEDMLAAAGRSLDPDIVVPDRLEDAITPISPDYDVPSAVPEQVRCLDQAGFSASPTWVHGDLAVVAADRA
jgi:hypothetical protein